MSYIGQSDYQHKDASPKTGVLITNLGTPDAPEPKAVRRYLKQFLSDRRVVEIPRLVWWFILNLFILPFRSKKSAALYKSIWTAEGSPLLAISKQQSQALQTMLDNNFPGANMPVALGMRYGNPSIESAIASLTANNVRNIIVLPLYPQYCSATTGSTFDAVSKVLSRYRWVPELKFINGYHQHPLYISALCDSIKQHIAEHGMPDKLVFSFHGILERSLKQGDPYYCFCKQTTRLVSQQLSLPAESVITTFQSRFGKATWLQPYTDVTLRSLAKQGDKHVAIICPGFSADCLETLEEIEGENSLVFKEAGGELFHYIPCLNSSDAHLAMMAELVQKYLVAAP